MNLADAREIRRRKNFYSKLSPSNKRKFELASIDDFLFWSRKTWVQFVYIYADNAENRALGRANSETGVRFGTRNLDLIPASKMPKKRNTNSKTIRYFDTGKYGTIRGADGKYKAADGGVVNGLWRSFRTGNVVAVLKVFSFVKNKFVTDFSDFFDKDQSAG